MKKYFYFIPALIFSCLLFTSFSSSIDGRAVIAARDELPQGIFAKTVGYLPGDTISITNLKSKKTVDVLIIGTISASEGSVAIILTPEAAELLGINKRMNCTVKITKRAGQLDRSVSGTAVIGEGVALSSDTDTDEAVNAETTSVKPESAPPAVSEEAADEAADTPEEPETAAEEEHREEESAPAMEAVVPEAAAEEKVSAEPEAVSEPVVAPKEKEAEPIAERVEVDDAFVPDPVEKPTTDTNTQERKPLPYEAVEADRIAEETAAAEKIAPESLEDMERNPAYEKLEETDGLPDNDPALCETVTDTPESVDASDKIAEEKWAEADLPEAAADKTEEVAAEDTVAPTPAPANGKDGGGMKDGSSYAPIVLVPADLNPPEGGEEMTDSADGAAEETAVADKAEAPMPEAAPAPSDKADEASDGGALSKYIVPSLKELERGKYYIQIAVLKDVNSVLSIIEKYKARYPIAVVPLASGAAQQVLIGPLGVDEYGAVQNRFKADGFKDAFMRKIR